MKIIASYNTLDSAKSNIITSYCMPDNTLIRNNDNFYIPNFCSEISAQCGIYIQLSKIGKHIEPQFIQRYYSHYGVAINFIAKPVYLSLLSQQLPTNIAFDFDHSLAISTVSISNQQIPLNSSEFSVQLNNKEFSFSVTQHIESIHAIIAETSKYYTYKIGDLFFIPIIEIDSIVQANDIFDFFIQNNHMLQCKIL